MATYTSDRGSVTFKLLLSAPSIDADSAAEPRHIPGGDNNVVDLAGQLTPTWEAEGLFSSYADFQAIMGLRNTVGTLDYTEDTQGTAASYSVILRKVSRRRVTGRGLHYCGLMFLILS